MKSERKPAKRHEVSKNTVKCPYFRSYYVGVCAGHKLPYVPNSDEKRQYCFNADFSKCTIYETYATRDPDQK